MNKKILLIGGGGHCKSILDTLYRGNHYSKIGIVDQNCSLEQIMDSHIVGTDADLPSLFMDGYKEAFISIGSVGSPKVRKKLFDSILEIGFTIPNIIDPSSIVSEHCNLGKGIFIGKRAIINAGASIANAAIINTGAIIEHDCIIDTFVHVAPGATLCGNVIVGKDTHIGAGATVIQGCKIGNNVVIGAGSVIVNSLEDSKKYYGVPGKEM